MKADRHLVTSIFLTILYLFGTAAFGAADQSAPGVTVHSPPTRVVDLGPFVESLEGAWLSAENDTPLGPMGMTMLFEWNDAGELHAHSPLNRETYLDVRFAKDEAGRWLLHEEAAMEGLGVQRYTLQPDGRTERGSYRWVLEERPDFLAIEVGRFDNRMHFDVSLRGEPHVAFRLDRQNDEMRVAIRQRLVEQRAQSPEEGTSIHHAMARSTPAPRPVAEAVDDPIAAARAAVEADPDSAAARLALAQAYGAEINANPANGPRYSFEMLKTLQAAIRLDPTLTDAYVWLAGYYLNAPAVAGGSIDRAVQLADDLDQYDRDGAQRIRALVEAHDAGPTH